MTRLQNAVVLVTGSTTGLGWGMANAFLKEEATVIFHGIDGSLEDIQSRTQKKNNLFYFSADLSKPEEIETLFNRIHSTVGEIDILVNNAGIQHVCFIEDFPTQKWDQILSVNLSSCFHTIRLSLPAMKRKNWGRIINICSAHGLVGSVQKSAYVAAKHGLVGLTKVVALENAQTDITCNAVCPGWVLTELVKKQIHLLAEQKNMSIEEAKKQLLIEKQPSGKFVTTEKISALCLFLASEQAGEIRGAAISIDGGWTAL